MHNFLLDLGESNLVFEGRQFCLDDHLRGFGVLLVVKGLGLRLLVPPDRVPLILVIQFKVNFLRLYIILLKNFFNVCDVCHFLAFRALVQFQNYCLVRLSFVDVFELDLKLARQRLLTVHLRIL